MKYYITTAIDYINGKPHIGHSYEKIAADVLARFHRVAGHDVFFLTGSDEHGAKIAEYAAKAGKPEQDYADEMSVGFKNAWDALGISYDRFIRTTDEDHVAAVGELLNTIKANGYLYEGEYSGYYCIGHEAFLTERELVNGKCPEHNTVPELITEKNWFLKVSAFTKTIQEKIESAELGIFPEHIKNEILSQLKEGFRDIAISRPNVKWGIPLPWDAGQTVYVWVDALTNYISGIGYPKDNEQFNRYWPADAHIIGRDISKFHCIIWPAMLLAADLPLPKDISVHGYLTIDNQKISKSLGNVIDPGDWVKKYGSDAVRYFLMREFPFGEDGDVSEAKLAARYTGELANGLGNLASRVSNMVEIYCQGVVPETLQPENMLLDADILLQKYKFNDSLALIWESIAWCNKLIDDSKPWELVKTDPEQVKQLLSRLSAQLLHIAYRLAPYMPDTAEKIRKGFEIGESIVKMEPLFPRIEK
jgi:methionyl-tRNA synthetase